MAGDVPGHWRCVSLTMHRSVAWPVRDALLQVRGHGELDVDVGAVTAHDAPLSGSPCLRVGLWPVGRRRVVRLGLAAGLLGAIGSRGR